MQSTSRPLARLLSSHLLVSASASRPTTSLLLRPSALSLPSSQPRRFASSSSDSVDQARLDLQRRQSKMADKLGRMKQDLGQMISAPVFANHIPPRNGRQFAKGTRLSVKMRYMWHDTLNTVQSLDVSTIAFNSRRKLKKVLGSGWYNHFQDRSLIAYKISNQAMATGNFDALTPLATRAVIDQIKATRVRSFSPRLGLSWKLHDVVSQTLVCSRQMELYKVGEGYAQIAVRFVTMQSLEVRDPMGKLIGNGSHEAPQEVIEYCVFQREVWHPKDDWTMIKKGANETDLIANPADQA
ncbi:BZ3500_MvSof-1268-A1-R1_Chr6-2g08618 [Microbotryum saponariae]|uniref:Large ribosomal subunit protein mL45 n=1 Tax=Microbotryum saponariae TaxID=289078 RepID=A0A2X0KN26_9BASI|nr:BZ3500_MvSof-1268-A1-R1_Chr6-2g08618 [Microbotryum saponariae]SDA07890.1 BZ3501_MvSof-1269-A2-R1_Chr6-1g08327 [Microbotryum saponariae]